MDSDIKTLVLTSEVDKDVGNDLSPSYINVLVRAIECQHIPVKLLYAIMLEFVDTPNRALHLGSL